MTIKRDANGKPTSTKYTRETNSFVLSVKRQCDPSPEGRMAAAVIESALRDILKYGHRRTPMGHLHLDAHHAAMFLLKANPLLWLFCDYSGLSMSYIVQAANAEVRRFGFDPSTIKELC